MIGAREKRTISCALEIEKTAESFHAYAIPVGIEIREGDVVRIHDAPIDIAFGERLVRECRATVTRANLLDRAWTRLASLFELTELYEVGFQPKEPA